MIRYYLILATIFASTASLNLYCDNKPYKPYGLQQCGVFLPWEGTTEFVEIAEEIKLDYHIDIRYYQYIFAKHCMSLEGSYIECGTCFGEFPDLVASLQKRYASYKKIYAIDSFEGLDSPDPTVDFDAMTGKPFFKKGDLKASYQDVKNKLAKHSCPIYLIKGWIPSVFNELTNEKFAMAHIDVDLYQATLDSLHFVYNRMVKGGVILMDDYGCCFCAGAKKAADEFFADKPEVIFSLPTFGAFVIKN